MRELVERDIDERGVMAKATGNGREQRRRVTVNLGESPLSWLVSRGLVDARQEEAGERLRTDHEIAGLFPRVTMNWGSVRVDGGGGDRVDPQLAQIAAKRRFDAAMAAAGPGLKEVLWHTICACEGLAVTEKGLGWPPRSARVVLTLALDRLADHYGLK